MIANGVSESPIDYMITYSDGLSFIVPSEACVADTCSHVYTLASTPEKDEYTISVAARNTVGVGVPATSNLIGMFTTVYLEPIRTNIYLYNYVQVHFPWIDGLCHNIMFIKYFYLLYITYYVIV